MAISQELGEPQGPTLTPTLWNYLVMQKLGPGDAPDQELHVP